MNPPQPSFTNSYLILDQRAILVPKELLASRRTGVESPLVVIRQESFGFGEVHLEVRMQSCGNHLRIRTRRSECLPCGCFLGVEQARIVLHPSQMPMLT